MGRDRVDHRFGGLLLAIEHSRQDIGDVLGHPQCCQIHEAGTVGKARAGADGAGPLVGLLDFTPAMTGLNGDV
jgi:hypothetical protein